MKKRAIKGKLAGLKSTGAPNDDISTHQFVQAMFKLRLDLKALAAVVADDQIIARPSGHPIHLTALHEDALLKVCEVGRSALRTSINQVIECFRILHVTGGPRESTSALRAVRNYLEIAAGHLTPPFTNGRRMMASQICTEACDLCGLAIRNLAINIRPIGS